MSTASVDCRSQDVLAPDPADFMFLGEGSIVAGLMPAVEAMAGGAPVRVGRFRFDVATTSWAWSDGMFRFHGFAPGDVVPTSELMAAQVYPEDSRNARQAVMTALADGEPFSCRQRIKDAAGRTRTVVVIGQGTRDRPGRVIELSGYYIAVTEQLRRDVAELAEQALDKAMESRAAIEQAKGALMLAYSVDEELAFDLLRWHSQHANIRSANWPGHWSIGSTNPVSPRWPLAGGSMPSWPGSSVRSTSSPRPWPAPSPPWHQAKRPWRKKSPHRPGACWNSRVRLHFDLARTTPATADDGRQWPLIAHAALDARCIRVTVMDSHTRRADGGRAPMKAKSFRGACRGSPAAGPAGSPGT
jgi:hypothetical protein